MGCQLTVLDQVPFSLMKADFLAQTLSGHVLRSKSQQVENMSLTRSGCQWRCREHDTKIIRPNGRSVEMIDRAAYLWSLPNISQIFLVVPREVDDVTHTDWCDSNLGDFRRSGLCCVVRVRCQRGVKDLMSMR